MICKLRISAHPLAIEKGRYSNVPRSERFCNACKKEIVEDEEHFFYYTVAFIEKLEQNCMKNLLPQGKILTHLVIMPN